MDGKRRHILALQVRRLPSERCRLSFEVRPSAQLQRFSPPSQRKGNVRLSLHNLQTVTSSLHQDDTCSLSILPLPILAHSFDALTLLLSERPLDVVHQDAAM